jgi:hypothetical protein
MSASNIVSHAERTGSLGDDESLRELLDFLITEEQLGVTLVSPRSRTRPAPPQKRSFRSCATASPRNTFTWRHSRKPAASH